MENTSDSLMPRPLLLCLKSEKIVCYSVPDNSVTEELKMQNQIEWVRRMNNIKNVAEEMVLLEIIYA